MVEAYARLSHVAPDSHAAAVLTRCLADPDAAVRLAVTARLHCAGALVLPNVDLEGAYYKLEIVDAIREYSCSPADRQHPPARGG